MKLRKIEVDVVNTAGRIEAQPEAWQAG